MSKIKNKRLDQFSDPDNLLKLSNMCLRKKVFWSEGEASVKIRELEKEKVYMRTYQCPNCFQWHLTRI